jgi:flagellar hook-associated protein 2
VLRKTFLGRRLPPQRGDQIFVCMVGPSSRNSTLPLLTLILVQLLFPVFGFSQGFSIPGATSKYNSEETIKKLMEAEAVPLARMEQEREIYKGQKAAWLRLNQRMITLRDAARELYGFQNPFGNKIASSSDESVLTATAERTAVEKEATIKVKKTAGADRFVSKPLPKDYMAPAGTYRFQVGDQEVRLNFRGGSLKELANLINTKAADLLKASVVADSKNTEVFVIESTKTGARNKLTFHDQAAVFGEQTGILERSIEASRSVRIDRYALADWEGVPEAEKPSALEGVSVSEDTLTLDPRSQVKIPLRPPHSMKPNMVLSLEIRVHGLPEEAYEQPEPPPGPELPAVGEIEFEGIEVESARSRTVLPEWQPPEPPRRIDDPNILFVEDGGRLQPLPPVEDTEEFVTLEFEAEQLPQTISALGVRNRNTHRIVQVRNIRIYDKTARGEYRAVNPLSEAGDAVIVMDGIEIIRESNEIDDVLPGVNITLHGSSDRPVSLSVARDLESIEEALFNFIGYYNQLLMHVDILTRQDEEVVETAVFLNADEKEQAARDLGLFQGNTTLMQLKSRLQRIMMDPHSTEGGRELSLLAQIGISTSGGRLPTSGAIDKARLRGYLQIDEAKLEESLVRMGEWVRQLFGYDSDKDLAVDTGVGYEVDSYLKAYVETGGIVANRLGALDGTIARKEREIDEFNEHLDDYERELRRKFGTMEGALDSLEKSSQAIENLNRRND